MSDIQSDNVTPKQSDHVDAKDSMNTDTVNDKVEYQTYRKVVGKSKRLQTENEDMRSELDSMRQDKLQADGKKDELIDALQKQNTDLKGKYHSAVGGFAKSKAYDAIVDKAVEYGVTSVSLLKKAVEDKLDTLEFDDGFSPNADQVNNLLVELKQREPILFSKSGPDIANHQIKTGDAAPKEPGKSLRHMSEEELDAVFAASLKG